LDEVSWRSPEWVRMNGLTTENVLDYFALSPFYDRTANNQVLKMQQVTGSLIEQLRRMRGIEFVVAVAKEPELWVIRKQNRIGPDETIPLSTYFVANEIIYMAPSVYSVVSSHVLNLTKSLKDSLAT
ncbi:hypothetical protein CANCADRAFT_14293, partial [Tortispora caseinolytica NRRL Y-17796]